MGGCRSIRSLPPVGFRSQARRHPLTVTDYGAPLRDVSALAQDLTPRLLSCVSLSCQLSEPGQPRATSQVVCRCHGVPKSKRASSHHPIHVKGCPQRSVIDGVRSVAVAGSPNAAVMSETPRNIVLATARGSSVFFARPNRASGAT